MKPQNLERQHRETAGIIIPLNTGEDIYLKEISSNSRPCTRPTFFTPTSQTSSGILETHKIGDAIEEYGVPMAMHFAGWPVCCTANVHCAAATTNFLVMENHSVDVPWCSDLAEGLPKPIVEKGFINVPDKPGLGLTLNEDTVKQHLARGTQFFAPTDEWNQDRSNDRLWSMSKGDPKLWA
jgi:L-alanine-DL-glutamate epimerase-like enolase superfamily enzyme